MPEANQVIPSPAFIPTLDQTLIADSAEQTGTGAVQNVAHLLNRVPTRVIIYITGGPAAYTQPSIVQGAHTNVNFVVTVTTGWKFRILAW